MTDALALATATARPMLRLKPGRHRRVQAGHPWIYSNEIEMDRAARALPAGTMVRIERHDGGALATAFFNPHTLIAARVLDRDPSRAVDAAFFAERLAYALALRERLFDRPYYRLVHAEADGLPGLVVDRFGDVTVVQPNTAGMDRCLDDILAALDRVLAPRVIVVKGDTPARGLEGLDARVECAKGALDGPVTVEENGARFFAELATGQKTGWFFDHRENRAFMAGLARRAAVLDLYTYLGGFAIPAALGGARRVVAVDRSAPALALAEAAARANAVAERVEFRKAEAFAELKCLAQGGETFDVVIADPPAFVKSRKDYPAGIRGYRKLAGLAAAVTAPGGLLLLASCSHAVAPDRFADAVVRGLGDAGRQGRIIRSAGAAADHPLHPQLAESAYLKTLVFALD